MKGFFYRLGERIREAGERNRLRFLVYLGLAIRDRAAEQ
jgi:hypothetical protein